jgi:hypothetical protein
MCISPRPPNSSTVTTLPTVNCAPPPKPMIAHGSSIKPPPRPVQTMLYVLLPTNPENLNKPAQHEKTLNIMHYLKLPKLTLLMDMLLSAGNSYILAPKSPTTSATMTTLQPASLLQTKAWELLKKYGKIHILTPTANISYSVQSLSIFSFGDVKPGHYKKPFFAALKYFFTAAYVASSTFPSWMLKTNTFTTRKSDKCSIVFHVYKI